MIKPIAGIVALTAVTLMVPFTVFAQEASTYPERAIEIVVGFPAGGAVDIFARVTAEALQQSLGQPVVVINKPGAGGILAAQEVANAQPDGYTLMMASPAITTAPYLQATMPFDPKTAFTPVSTVVSGSSVFVVNTEVPVTNFSELISYSTEHPGEVTFASTGAGSTNHLMLELIADATGLNLTHVPYTGGAQVAAALGSREADSTLIDLGNARSLIEAGTVQVLAQLGEKRSEAFADVETFDEQLMPGFVSKYWLGLVAPAGTDPAIVEKLNAAVVEFASSPELTERADTAGMVPDGSTSSEFSEMITADADLWLSVIEANGLRAAP